MRKQISNGRHVLTAAGRVAVCPPGPCAISDWPDTISVRVADLANDLCLVCADMDATHPITFAHSGTSLPDFQIDFYGRTVEFYCQWYSEPLQSIEPCDGGWTASVLLIRFTNGDLGVIGFLEDALTQITFWEDYSTDDSLLGPLVDHELTFREEQNYGAPSRFCNTTSARMFVTT